MTQPATLPAGPVRITRDGQPASPLLPGLDAAMAWLQRHQPMSTEWAMTHEGYAVQTAGSQPWTPEEAHDLQRTARRMLADHGHPARFASREDRQLTRENCGACTLAGGRDVETTEGGHLEPNYSSWERTYVQAQRPVPARWVAALHAELNEGTPYAEGLARDLATWGLRTTD